MIDQPQLAATPQDPEQPPGVRNVAVGDVLGQCLLTDALGRGGSCAVFRALHQGLNIAVAVKVLQADEENAQRAAYEQLRAEARLLAQLDHPHIVRALDFVDDPALPYLVLEVVEGPSLSDLIQQSGRLSVLRACEVIGQTAEALGVLWALGGVHRDVKPGNILLTRAGAAKLADLGSAVLLREQDAEADADPARGDVIGTAAYLAPEQFLAPASVDHRADIYALGASFYEAVTGRLPFEGRSRAEILLKHAKEPPPNPRDIVPELSDRVADVILTMLAKDPDDRYQDLAELRQALGWATGEDVELVETESDGEALAPGDLRPPLAKRTTRQRRSLWQALLPDLRRRPARNDEWLSIVKRTLKAPPRPKG